MSMQKTNYQKETEKILKEIKQSGETPKLLLQSCCGPCSSYVLQYLTNFFDIFVYYFNPNIFPETEYLHRLETQKQLIASMPSVNNIRLLPSAYNHDNFLQYVKGLEKEMEGGDRCTQCFSLRLEETAKKAKEIGAHYFGTTLTVSPHKVSENIFAEAFKAAKTEGVEFARFDFKKNNGFNITQKIANFNNMYKQTYCGCKFSIRKLKENENKIELSAKTDNQDNQTAEN